MILARAFGIVGAVALAATATLAVGTAEANWQTRAGMDGAGAGATARSGDGLVTASVSCRPTSGVSLSFAGYRGDALPREGGATDTLRVDIFRRQGGQRFAVPIRYDADAARWVSAAPIGRDLLRAWARGARMSFTSPDGGVVAGFDLAGTARALRAMGRACGTAGLGAPASGEPGFDAATVDDRAPGESPTSRSTEPLRSTGSPARTARSRMPPKASSRAQSRSTAMAMATPTTPRSSAPRSETRVS